MRSDEQLVASYQDSGRREALEELAERHLGAVRAMIYPMVLDKTVADDLTQEVFLRAIRGLAGFDGRAKFSTWLYRVAMNTTHSFLARRNRSPVSFQRELPDQPQQTSKTPEGTAMENELDGAIRAALADLTPKLRAAIVLTALEQKDAAEAARIEGCSTATMYWRIHEARKQLKKRLEGHLAP